MAKSRGSGAIPMWKQQADAVLVQANPVSGTKYTVLDTTNNVRIKSLRVDCTWTVQPTPLEIHATIDGIAFMWTKTDPVSATAYFGHFWEDTSASGIVLDVSVYGPSRAFLMEGKSVKIEVEITGGTVSNLGARVKYAKKV